MDEGRLELTCVKVVHEDLHISQFEDWLVERIPILSDVQDRGINHRQEALRLPDERGKALLIVNVANRHIVKSND